MKGRDYARLTHDEQAALRAEPEVNVAPAPTKLQTALRQLAERERKRSDAA